jgi:hypothetical protein
MLNQKFNKDIIIIYSGNSLNGICSAWCFQHMLTTYLEPLAGIEIEYYPAYHEKQNIPNVKNRTIIMLDLMYSKENMINLISDSHFTFIFSHCTICINELIHFIPYKLVYEFDNERNITQITWDFFNKGTRPWFIDYIADYDLCKNILPNTKEIISALYMYEQSIQTYEMLWNKSLFDPYFKDQIVEKGKICLLYRENIIKQLKKSATIAKYDNYKVYILSCPSIFQQDVSSQLLMDENCDFIMLYTYEPLGYFSFSLRGMKEKIINEIIDKYGGNRYNFIWNKRLDELVNIVI